MLMDPPRGAAGHIDWNRACRFLERDLPANVEALCTLLYAGGQVLGVADSGEGMVGVAVAEPQANGRPAFLRVDAIGPIALRRLLATIEPRPERFLLQHDWLLPALQTLVGPLRTRFQVVVYSALDPRAVRAQNMEVRELSDADQVSLLALDGEWTPEILARYLGRGWHIYGVFAGDLLVAQACCGYPTIHTEEVGQVFTRPEWRGRGLATAVVSMAARSVVTRGRQPVYLARAEHAASRHVAERCGLQCSHILREVETSGA